MITAIDTNILALLWEEQDSINLVARSALRAARERGSLIVAAPVYAELLAFPSRTETFLDGFLRETNVIVDWELTESIWRTAGQAYQSYAARRRRHGELGPRRILADFVIGAHAFRNRFALLTFDDRIYRAAFPALSIITPTE